jgi:tellurium resistance protein TerD
MAGLQRGANVALTREIPHLTGVIAGIGWSADTDPALQDNLAVAAVLCDSTGRAISDRHVVFFNQPVDEHQCAALVPSTSSYDKEHIEVDLAGLPVHVARIVLVLYVNHGVGAPRTLAQVRRCHTRILDLADRRQIISSENLAGAFGTEAAAVLGEVYRHNGAWKFQVVGEGVPGGIHGLFARYGVMA